MRKDIVYLNLYEFKIQEKSKTPTTYEMELFVTLANCGTPLAHVSWGDRGPRNTSELIFLKILNVGLKKT